MSLLKRIRQTGIRYSMAIAFNRIVPASLFRFRRFVIYRVAASKAVELARIRSGDLQPAIRWCRTTAEIAALEELTYFDSGTATGIVRGCQALIDGSLQGGIWAATEGFEESELGVLIQLDKKQAWLFAALVAKSARRSGLYRSILAFVLNDLESEGLDELYVAVNPDNIGSNRVHQQHACETVGTVFAIRLFRTALCFSSGRLQRDRLFTWNSHRQPIAISIGSPVAADSNSLTTQTDVDQS